MSRYSGKCDCYDTLVMIHEYTEEELKNNVRIYVGWCAEPLHVEKASDLIPYYPYLVDGGSFSKDDRNAVIHLSSESFVDMEEQSVLEFYLQQILKIWKKCKRKKIAFQKESVLKEVCLNGWNQSIYEELIERVDKYGKKAMIDGLHLKTHDYYREQLVDEMIKNDIDPAEYGYRRFINKETENI